MLSAETAAGDWPEEAVQMMDSIAVSVERDPDYIARLHFTETEPDATTADALAEATTSITRTVSASAIICFTVSGSTARRVARERSEEHTSELQSLMRISYAVFCLKKKKQ